RSRLSASGGGQVRRAGARTPVVYALRAELVEFEQIFDKPDSSRGVLRLRATLEGEGLWAQRTFTLEKPASTADAVGGVRALAQCSDELAALISEWVATSRSSTREAEVSTK